MHLYQFKRNSTQVNIHVLPILYSVTKIELNKSFRIITTCMYMCIVKSLYKGHNYNTKKCLYRNVPLYIHAHEKTNLCLK